eukprot:366079-Chlamydomonas_euryale.AAC.3
MRSISFSFSCTNRRTSAAFSPRSFSASAAAASAADRAAPTCVFRVGREQRVLLGRGGEGVCGEGEGEGGRHAGTVDCGGTGTRGSRVEERWGEGGGCIILFIELGLSSLLEEPNSS